MKRTLGLGAIAALVAVSLAACGSAPESSTQSQSGAASYIKACMVSDSGGFDDRSFNESGYDGMVQARDELGVSIDTAESTSDSDYIPNINNMVQGGCDLIIGVGYLMADAMVEAAEANPDIEFALIDDSFETSTGNGKALLFNTAEASYLAGYLAAGMTETGVVGVYVGMNLPSTAIFADGYVDGVAEYNSVHGTEVQVLGWDKDSQDGMISGDFENQSMGRQLTQNLIDQDADVIMPVAGPVGLGTLAAAQEAGNGTKVIWVDSDGYESNSEYGDVLLTSVKKEIAAAVYDTIESVVNGTFTDEAYIGTLENGGVGLAPFHDFENQVPAELQEELEELTQRIISGDITVESVNSPTSGS